MKTKRLTIALTLALGLVLTLLWLLGGNTIGGASAQAVPRSQTEASMPTAQITTVFTEGFEVSVPPPGWIEEDILGTDGDWLQSSDTVHPSGGGVHSGSYLAYFNSYSASWGDTTSIYTTNVDLDAADHECHLSFWMYHSSDCWDSLYIDVDDGSGWTYVSSIECSTPPSGWAQHIVDLTAYAGEVISLSFTGFKFDGSGDIHIDDVHLYHHPLVPQFDIVKKYHLNKPGSGVCAGGKAARTHPSSPTY